MIAASVFLAVLSGEQKNVGICLLAVASFLFKKSKEKRIAA